MSHQINVNMWFSAVCFANESERDGRCAYWLKNPTWTKSRSLEAKHAAVRRQTMETIRWKSNSVLWHIKPDLNGNPIENLSFHTLLIMHKLLQFNWCRWKCITLGMISEIILNFLAAVFRALCSIWMSKNSAAFELFIKWVFFSVSACVCACKCKQNLFFFISSLPNNRMCIKIRYCSFFGAPMQWDKHLVNRLNLWARKISNGNVLYVFFSFLNWTKKKHRNKTVQQTMMIRNILNKHLEYIAYSVDLFLPLLDSSAHLSICVFF